MKTRGDIAPLRPGYAVTVSLSRSVIDRSAAVTLRSLCQIIRTPRDRLKASTSAVLHFCVYW